MSGPTHVTVRVPLRIKRRAGRKTIVMPVLDGLPASTATRADPTLLKALARAFRYQRMLDEGRFASISEMAAAEKLERGYLGSLLRLTLLAPDIVEGLLAGSRACYADLQRQLPALPLSWADQHKNVRPQRPRRHVLERSTRAIVDRHRSARRAGNRGGQHLSTGGAVGFPTSVKAAASKIMLDQRAKPCRPNRLTLKVRRVLRLRGEKWAAVAPAHHQGHARNAQGTCGSSRSAGSERLSCER
jgi:hypothetical protein